MPTISVLMTVFNAERFIKESIESILFQSFSDFEFIILNDGSTDNSLNIIQSFSDVRIRIVNDGKLGYYFAKQRLIEEAKCEYIAIMDADDIAHPTRFEKQLLFLQNNPTYSLVSARANYIDVNNKDLKKSIDFFESNDEIKCNLLFTNVIVHPCVMIRKSILDEHKLNYLPIAGEDFDLWIRIAQRSKVYNLNNFLLSYRIHPNNMTHSKWYTLKDGIQTLITNEIKYYFFDEVDDIDIKLHLSLIDFSLKNKLSDLPLLQSWIQKLITLNQRHKHFDEQILKQVLYERVLKKYLRLTEYNFSVFQNLIKIKKILQPTLTFELRKKELAILVFSIARKKIIQL
jgi:glycosyltransferase involved in cell wall biosynthesis